MGCGHVRDPGSNRELELRSTSSVASELGLELEVVEDGNKCQWQLPIIVDGVVHAPPPMSALRR